MKILIFAVLLSLSFLAGASNFCQRSRSDIVKQLASPESRIHLKNQGGLMGGGVCWWHARLQRSSLYLASFLPDKPKPDRGEVRMILQRLRRMSGVVLIPGYENFNSFTQDFPEEVQQTLDEWQRIDGFLNFAWIRGISGRSYLSAGKLEARLERIFRTYLASPTPVWLLAQIKGITAHSFLLHQMRRTSEGFELAVVDSNRPLATFVVSYRRGDTKLRAPVGSYTFVPYTGFQNDFHILARALKAHCAESYFSPGLSFDSVEAGDLEIP